MTACSPCTLGIVVDAEGGATLACADADGDHIACGAIAAAELHQRVLSLAQGRAARVRVEGPGSAALEVALRLARLPAAEVTILRAAPQRRPVPVLRRALQLAAEARRAA